MGRGAGGGLAWAVSLATLGLILLAVSPSLAVAAPSTTFATSGEGAGQVSNPAGVAVDQTSGDIYVADGNNFRIDKFDAAGRFRLAWGFSVADGSSLELQTCGPEATPPTAECFAPERGVGGGAGSEAPGAVTPVHVAVDQTTGDVYVTSFRRFAVQKFGPDGEFILVFGDEVDKTTGADVCTASDLAAGDECGGGVQGTGAGQLESSSPPIAVDGSGNVWVGDNGRLEEFGSGGNYLSEVALPGAEFSIELGSLAIDSAGDFYVVDSVTPGVQKLTSAGTEIETLDPTGGAYRTLALDGVGNVFVADRQEFESAAVFREFNPAGEQVAQFGSGEVFGTTGPFGIAVGDSAEALYSTSFSFASRESAAQRFPLPQPGPLISGQHASGVLPTSATLAATLDPEGHETTYYFEYGATGSYGESTPVGTVPAGFVDAPVEAAIAGLLPASTYHFRLVAEDSEGHIAEGADQTFTTLPAVQISGESATAVTATAATFGAELNPLGAAAEWWVEYGTDASYGLITPIGNIAPGVSPVAVSVSVTGLIPGATYHYRFVARDEREGVVYVVGGEDQTLTTQGAASVFGLPDGRSWEMVTPQAKPGFVLPLGEYGNPQAAASGLALAYLTAPLSEEAPGSRGTDSVIADRASTGWESRDLALPESEVIGVNGDSQYPYVLFDPELSESIIERTNNSNQVEGDKGPLSPEASERTPYVRRVVCDPNHANCFTPMVTGKAGFANVPPGTAFGPAVHFETATPDLRHAIVNSTVALSAEEAPEGGLYEWSAASRELQLVSVLPGGGAAPRAELGYENYLSRQAISADGSRTVFTSEGHLYMRDATAGETVRLDVPQGGSGAGPVGTNFQTASDNGSRVFFTSVQKLTADSGAAELKPDLYVCEMQADPTTGALECALGDLTPSVGGVRAAVRYLLPGASADGSTVYFVANGALAGGAAAGDCQEEGVPSGTELCNLYVARYAAGHWGQPHFIATLSGEDRPDWNGGAGGVPRLNHLTARVSPDGRWLAFMSSRPLTGYDSRDVASGEPDEEVYLYDSIANAGEGQLLCASCNPSGARPQGEQIHLPSEAVDAQKIWTDRWLAANIPGWVQSNGSNIPRQPRYLADSGRLFFNSADALSPRDSNGTWDVYEFEPASVGDCAAGGSTFSARNSGCVSLISSGSSARQSTFMDASESGDDVFFWTHAKLSSADTDTAADIYDAHACIAAAPCLAPPSPSSACGEAAACRGPAPPAPPAATPGTSVFSGPGNKRPRHHHKHRKKRHHHHHKRGHGKAHGGKSHDNGRTGR